MTQEVADSDIVKEHKRLCKIISYLSISGIFVLLIGHFFVVPLVDQFGIDDRGVVEDIFSAMYAFIALILTVLVWKDKKILQEKLIAITVQNRITLWLMILCSCYIYPLYHFLKHKTSLDDGEWPGDWEYGQSTVEVDNCRRCMTEISTRAFVCPACDYEPEKGLRKYGRDMHSWAVVAGLTVVGLIIALPLWWHGSKSIRIAEHLDLKPTNTDPDEGPFDPPYGPL